MNTKLLILGIVRFMARHKLRTFLMSIGVALGVAAVVAGRTLGAGAERDITQKVNRMFGPGTILIIARGAGGSTLEIADLESVEDTVDEVVAWDPVVRSRFEVGHAGEVRSVSVSGHSERADLAWNRSVIDGRYLTNEDYESSSRVALVGTKIAERLFGDASPIGQEILIKSVPFRVVGVLEPIGIDPHGEDRDEDVVIPTTTAMRRLLNTDTLTMAKIVVRNPDIVDETSDAIEALLRKRHRIADGERADFGIYTSKFAGQKVKGAMRVLQLYVPLAGGVVLLVAGIVISTIMLASVRGRIAEVGLRKAVGATREQIGYQFLVEAVAVSLLSGAAGVALGAIVSVFAAGQMHIHAGVTADSILLGLAAAVVVGALSGVLPARRAARLDPVEALR